MVGCLIFCAIAGPVRAGALDGTWCSPDGRRITVAGTSVLTPGGQRTSGIYNREAFHFLVPPNEWDAGKSIWMELKSPDSVRVSTLAENQQGPPPHDRWQRCAATGPSA